MFNYPLSFEFKISTFSNDFNAKDSQGNTIAYVRQKMFKLKEKVVVFSDETKSKELFHIKADKWLDFNTAYNFTSAADGIELGKVCRKGWVSFLKARYELYDENEQQDLLIEEENPWTKFWDGLFKQVPIVSMFTGYFFNPRYTVKRPDGKLVGRFSKEKSFFGRKFSYDKLAEYEKGEELRVLLGLMMMVLLERRRG
jgi:uncharacterized protein YxjI